MLVFHSFKLRAKAVEFAKKFKGTVYDSQAASDAVEPHAGELKPPIVLVERPVPWDKSGEPYPDTEENADRYAAEEEKLIQAVKNFGGKCAGS